MATLEALNDLSDDDDENEDDPNELRKQAVRGMPKSQSLKELRLNSKHIVSQVITSYLFILNSNFLK